MKAPSSATMPAGPGAAKGTAHTLTEGLTTQEEIRARMKKVAASLGVKCSHCHDTSDFEKPTDMKNVANLMWDRMVVGLKTKDGADLSCEHCHNGKAKFLDRSDKEALKEWMKVNFVEKLAPKDGSKMECDTCHRGARWEFLPRG
jgi:cytochrome c7-like protein